MKEAIDHIALAWNNVSQITIQNCWNKTGILPSYDAHDDERPLVSIKKAVNGLKTFISFFEQQNDLEFDVNDLHILRKYLRVVRVKEINTRKQSTLDLFFNDCGI